jgi:uncharacterized protein (TIGR03083 family)
MVEVTMSETDWEWLRSQVSQASTEFQDQLKTLDDTSVRVPNLEWSVAELASHVIATRGVYGGSNEIGEAFETPTSWADFSQAARSYITSTDASELGDLLQESTEALLDDLGPDPNATRMLYGIETTSAGVAAGYLGELLLHAHDLARLTGADVEIDARQAHAIIGQYMTLAPAFVDPAKARRCAGTYHVSIRGGDDFTYVVADGRLAVTTGKPDRADARLVADPVAYVMVTMGRMGTLRAALSGRVVGYGRRPWLLARLGDIVADGI